MDVDAAALGRRPAQRSPGVRSAAQSPDALRRRGSAKGSAGRAARTDENVRRLHLARAAGSPLRCCLLSDAGLRRCSIERG